MAHPLNDREPAGLLLRLSIETKLAAPEGGDKRISPPSWRCRPLGRVADLHA
jgi:hypothetical protein